MMDMVLLMRKVNESLGKEALQNLYNALDDDEFNALQEALLSGDVTLHTEMMLGFTADTPEGNTSEGLV